jgi:hypothetical protein
MNYKIFLFLIMFGFPYLINSQVISETFSSTAPSTSIWSSTSSSWNFAYNASSTGNSRTGNYSSRLSSASTGNGKYIYIKLTVVANYQYSISFWTKRVCNVSILTNETANQTSVLSTTTINNASCASNFSTWYSWSATYTPTFSGTMYFQLLMNTVYGGPTSVYLDDVTINETNPLPIELAYFKSSPKPTSNIIQWLTYSEYNNYEFILYRSENGIEWTEMFTLPGNGTTSISSNYSFEDEELTSNMLYYMLKQRDFNGEFNYYGPISAYNPISGKSVKRVTDILGREINMFGGDIKIVEYEDGDKFIMTGNNF